MADSGVTLAKASCPDCGDVEVFGYDIRFVMCTVADRSFYEFTCPSCAGRVRKPAGPEIVRLLTLGGVQPERLDIPAEALEDNHGAPLSWDDVLDFTARLETVDIMAALTRSG